MPTARSLPVIGRRVAARPRRAGPDTGRVEIITWERPPLPADAALPAPAAPPRNAYRVYLDSLGGAGSRRALGACLHRIAALFLTAHGLTPGPAPAETFPWAALRAEHTAMIRALLEQQSTPCADGTPRPWSAAYRNKHLSALRGVLDAAWRLGELGTDEHRRARAVRNFPGSRLPAGRSVHAAEFTALLRVCAADASAAGRRDAALLAVLYTTGARRSEVIGLRREDYDPGERSLRITGKGGKERLEYLHERAALLLGAWLAPQDAAAGPLFTPVHRSGAIQRRAMTDAAVRNVVVKRRRQALLPPMTPHDFRRTFIGNLLDAGVDLATAQHLVGHASPATTARYDRRPERQRRGAVDRLPFPAAADYTR
jgi:integrase